MKLFLLLSLQAAAAPPPAPDAEAGAVDFDLARYKSSDDPGGMTDLLACERSRPANEIVVCARRQPYAYPLGKMARIYEGKPLRAETGLGGGAVADVHLEDATMPNGMISHRVMVGIKLPF